MDSNHRLDLFRVALKPSQLHLREASSRSRTGFSALRKQYISGHAQEAKAHRKSRTFITSLPRKCNKPLYDTGKKPMRGVEPPFLEYKTRVIAIILHRQKIGRCGNALWEDSYLWCDNPICFNLPNGNAWTRTKALRR